MNFSSKLIQDAVEQFSRLPGIGRKSALRLTLHLLKMGGPSLHLLKINDVGGGNDMVEIV